jgi:hypothetical protein
MRRYGAFVGAAAGDALAALVADDGEPDAFGAALSVFEAGAVEPEAFGEPDGCGDPAAGCGSA